MQRRLRCCMHGWFPVTGSFEKFIMHTMTMLTCMQRLTGNLHLVHPQSPYQPTRQSHHKIKSIKEFIVKIDVIYFLDCLVHKACILSTSLKCASSRSFTSSSERRRRISSRTRRRRFSARLRMSSAVSSGEVPTAGRGSDARRGEWEQEREGEGVRRSTSTTAGAPEEELGWFCNQVGLD